jgi:hypothetical protein
MAELQKFLSLRRSILTPITHQELPKHGVSGILYVKFRDSRALPRLLLPRVIERLAEVLRCDPLSVVVVPFEDSDFFAANAENMASTLMLAVYQNLPFCQGDNIHVKHKVSWNPFKVSFSTHQVCASLFFVCLNSAEFDVSKRNRKSTYIKPYLKSARNLLRNLFVLA